MFSDTHRCTATPLFLVFKIDNFYSIRLLSDTFLFIFLGRLSCIHTFMYLLRILLVSFARKKIKYPITDHLPTPGSCPTHLLTRSYTLPAGRRFTSNNYSHPSAKTLVWITSSISSYIYAVLRPVVSTLAFRVRLCLPYCARIGVGLCLFRFLCSWLYHDSLTFFLTLYDHMARMWALVNVLSLLSVTWTMRRTTWRMSNHLRNEKGDVSW